ncbi:MAG: hypothetical protein SVV03_02480 [Candidatus Nanohaloarchaea archaeon]|nr:hypothetical protein [Candidatus Nanohaloarchaea archaeon]
MKPTLDPVTRYPAVEIGSNLVVLQRGTRASELSDLTVDDIETVLTPSDRGRIADA